jgi:hypothetical protein
MTAQNAKENSRFIPDFLIGLLGNIAELTYLPVFVLSVK